MNLDQTIRALENFAPGGEEHEDIARLDHLLEGLAQTEQIQAATAAMLGIFERFPHALLGSPGPLVHCIERIGMDRFLPIVLESFVRAPNRMTLWMIERCLRSTPPAPMRFAMLYALRKVRRDASGVELQDEIDEALADYG